MDPERAMAGMNRLRLQGYRLGPEYRGPNMYPLHKKHLIIVNILSYHYFTLLLYPCHLIPLVMPLAFWLKHRGRGQ